MKRIFFAALICCIALLIWIAFQFVTINFHTYSPNSVTSPITEPSNIPSYPTVSASGTSYTYEIIAVATSSSITLIPNFTEKREAKALADENKCRGSVNGGFYDTAGKPLGFFYTDGQTYGKNIQSTLMNGYFWADTNGAAFISSKLTGNTTYRFSFQTGPILLLDGQRQSLTIQNDEHARRMVAAKTADGHYVFLTVYSADSVFSGPLLSELPQVVTSISHTDNLNIEDAINLDGGSASVFYNAQTNLGELTPVGSILCIK